MGRQRKEKHIECCRERTDDIQRILSLSGSDSLPTAALSYFIMTLSCQRRHTTVPMTPSTSWHCCAAPLLPPLPLPLHASTVSIATSSGVTGHRHTGQTGVTATHLPTQPI